MVGRRGFVLDALNGRTSSLQKEKTPDISRWIGLDRGAEMAGCVVAVYAGERNFGSSNLGQMQNTLSKDSGERFISNSGQVKVQRGKRSQNLSVIRVCNFSRLHPLQIFSLPPSLFGSNWFFANTLCSTRTLSQKISLTQPVPLFSYSV